MRADVIIHGSQALVVKSSLWNFKSMIIIWDADFMEFNLIYIQINLKLKLVYDNQGGFKT